MDFRGRIRVGTLFRLLLSGVLIAWFLLRSDPYRVFAALALIPAGLWPVLVAIHFASMLGNAVKWRLLLARSHPFGRLLHCILIGQYYSMLLPGQIAGEVVKVFRLTGGQPRRREETAASVVMDRFTGVASVALLFAAGAAISPVARSQGLLVWSVFVPVFLLGSFWGLQHPAAERAVKSGMLTLSSRFPFFGHGVKPLFRFFSAWQVYRKQPRKLLASIFFGVLIQLVCTTIVMVIGFGLGVALPFREWIWILALVSLFVFLPVTYGGLGLREGGFLYFLHFFDVPQEKALALSLSLFGLNVAGAAVGGILELTSRSSKMPTNNTFR